MPLTDYHIEIEHARLGLWHITEGEDFFLKKLPLSDADRAELSERKARKSLWFTERNDVIAGHRIFVAFKSIKATGLN